MSRKDERIKVGDRVTIFRRGKKGTYTAEFTLDGQHRRRSLRTSNKKVALQRATTLAADLEAGTYEATPKAVGISGAVEDYLAHHETKGSRPRTITTYRNSLAAFRDHCTSCGIKTLQRVTPSLFDRFRAKRKSGRSERTLYNQSVIVKMFLKWCRSRRLIAVDPLADYELRMPRAKRKPVPTLEQVWQVLTAADARLRSRLATLAFTGMRSGELRQLLVEDVDLRTAWVDVVSREETPTKTGESRRAPIHPVLQDDLRDSDESRGPWFFTSLPSPRYPEGGHWISTDRLNDQFERVAASVGPAVGSKAGFTVHSLRRFFKSHCLNSGVPKPVVDRWMGHDPTSSMDNLYYELDDTKSREWMLTVQFTNPKTETEK